MMSVFKRIRKTSDSINLCVEYLLFGLGFTMAVLVAVQVFFRYALNHSLFWSEELAKNILVWLTFFGASTAYYRKANPCVDFFYSKMNPMMRFIATLVVHIASMGLFGVMVIYGTEFAWFVRSQISPALQIHKWIILSIIPVSGAILMVHCLAELTEMHHNFHKIIPRGKNAQDCIHTLCMHQAAIMEPHREKKLHDR